VILIVGNRIFSANVGDSRAVLCRNNRAVNLTHDHKTVNIFTFSKYYSLDYDEVERIRSAGGGVSCGRVMNKLAITRAFGDFDYKIIKGRRM
jgi:serine/threonine protein phosphatase PrpC